MGRICKWFGYVDVMLVIVPKNTNLENMIRMFKQVNECIKFTVEMQVDEKLPFLDTVIHKVGSEARFSVYRKPTNKDDFIHYLSSLWS